MRPNPIERHEITELTKRTIRFNREEFKKTSNDWILITITFGAIRNTFDWWNDMGGNN